MTRRPLSVDLQRQLGRVTSGGRLIPVVDGLRCVAILSVILYHLEDYLTHRGVAWSPQATCESVVHRLLYAGHVGVPLFFALSGFILALPFYESAGGAAAGVPDLRRYYLRRVTRLEPPYLINLAIASVLLFAVNGVSWSELLPHLGASAVYAHNQVYGDLSTINPVAWSLEIEVQFYMIAPWLARWLTSLAAPPRRGVLLAAIVALIAARTLSGPWPARVELSLAGTAEHFLAGILLADLYVTSWKSNPQRRLRWDFVSVLAWPAIFVAPHSPMLLPCLPLLTIGAYTAAFRGRITHRALTWTPAVIAGGMCYTLYLYHFFVISAVGRFTLRLTESWPYLAALGAQAALIVPVVMAACAVLFRLFERPFMVWRPWQRARERQAATLPRVGEMGVVTVEAAFPSGAVVVAGVDAERV